MGDLDHNDVAYQTGNSVSMTGASGNVIDFMKAGKDPRVRFFYTKNAYNSEIIKEFIKEDKYDDLPTFVKENINLDANGQFESWKDDQALWARYQGTPIVLYGSTEYNKYKEEIFEPGNVRYQLVIGDANKSYGSGRSSLSQEMIRGRVDFTLPTIPAGPVIQTMTTFLGGACTWVPVKPTCIWPNSVSWVLSLPVPLRHTTSVA